MRRRYRLALLGGLLFCLCRPVDLAFCSEFDPQCSPAASLLYLSGAAATLSSTSAEITAYSIPALGINATIVGRQISLLAPNLTAFTPQIAAFTTTGSEVTVNGTVQTSGVTENSFVNNLVYTVRAADNSTQEYTVTLTAPRTYGGSSLRLWIRADSLGLADGATVATWNDESGQGNNFAQGTVGQRPIFRTNQINGLPVARFSSASTTTMTIAAPAAAIYSDAGADQNGSLFVVLRNTGSAGQTFFNLGGGNGRQFDFGATNEFLQGRNGVGYNYTSAVSLLNTYVAIGSIQSSNVSVNEIWNGDIKGGNAPACCSNYITAGVINLSVGGFNGDIAELLFFNTALSQNEEKKVFCYLRAKYNLTATNTSCGT